MVAIVAAVVFMIIIVKLLYVKSVYAPYLVAGIALAVAGSCQRQATRIMMTHIADRRLILQLQALESMALVLPWSFLLLYHGDWIIALLTVVLAGLAVFMSRMTTSRVMITPFGRRPFEGIVGWRQFWPVLGLLLVFMAIAHQVGNINFALVSYLGVGATFLFFYEKLEPSYFTWLYTYSPAEFLFHKIRFAWINYAVVALPLGLLLTLVMGADVGITLLVFGLSSAYIMLMVLAKYSSYPHSISLPFGMLFGLSIVFPFVLPVVAYIFYRQSTKKLRSLL